MFTARDRDEILDELLRRAREDPTVTAAAVVGSGARGATDQWSDIDLALRLDEATDPSAAADAWSAHLGARYPVADHLDVWSGPALYRVFLLENSLQVDLSFWPASDFASTGEPFRLVFGEANASRPPPPEDPLVVVGWGWLHALHARSALARGRSWQALQMIEGLRDRVITLACRRYGLADHQGRGVDSLPDAVHSALRGTLIGRLDHDTLVSALSTAVALLLDEVGHLDRPLAERLRPPLLRIAGGGVDHRHP